MSIKEKIVKLKYKTAQVYLAMKSSKTPWYAKAIAFITVAYALSPIDLIPDFIPVIGYLDDMIILPILIFLCIKLIPKEVMIEYEEDAKTIWKMDRLGKWYYAVPIVLVWLAIFGLILYSFIK